MSRLPSVAILAAVLLSCTKAPSVPAPEAPLPIGMFRATVVDVHDGNTLTIRGQQSGNQNLRLYGIDCPESPQPFGQEAAVAARKLVLHQDVIVTDMGRDQHQKMIGVVRLTDGRLLNQELVGSGLCWWYKSQASGNATLERLEAEARASRKGLWADQNPVPPWEWRNRGK